MFVPKEINGTCLLQLLPRSSSRIRILVRTTYRLTTYRPDHRATTVDFSRRLAEEERCAWRDQQTLATQTEDHLQVVAHLVRHQAPVPGYSMVPEVLTHNCLLVDVSRCNAMPSPPVSCLFYCYCEETLLSAEQPHEESTVAKSVIMAPPLEDKTRPVRSNGEKDMNFAGHLISWPS
ncbi:hypothetical protein T4D_14143 [Trichinella pseudospiralis]|uniref:Uncharacterized protein n=1 Tax=Trichinella pseudospiralis TaxID=6337 RepID=A0A0V1FA19_TRIPS|nr:hypothetical protein T4D_14143 [Trichinella pseudospiralis]